MNCKKSQYPERWPKWSVLEILEAVQRDKNEPAVVWDRITSTILDRGVLGKILNPDTDAYDKAD